MVAEEEFTPSPDAKMVIKLAQFSLFIFNKLLDKY